MKRISKEKFIDNTWSGTVTGIRIQNGEFYWLCDIEEWPDAPDYNKEGLRVFAPYKEPIGLDRHMVFEGCLDVTETDAYEGSRMTYYYETEEECAECNVYESMLSLITPYERNGESEPDDYDIFVVTKEEFIDLCDALRDGDYVIIIG